MLKKHLMVTLFCLFSLVRCSSFQRTVLPRDTNIFTNDLRVQLPHLGRIVLKVPFKDKAQTCATVKNTFVATVTSKRSYQNLSLVNECKDDHVVVKTKYNLKPGDYLISTRVKSMAHFEKLIEVSTIFVNADFSSGEDVSPFKATPLANMQPMEGAVTYTAGDQTDWFVLDGLVGAFNLNFKPGSKGSTPLASVYRMGHDGNMIRVQRLGLGKINQVSVQGLEKVFVKVQGQTSSGMQSYSLLRIDRSIKPVQVAQVKGVEILDSYQIAENESLILLAPQKGLVEQSRVNIFERKASGRRISLGVCQVVSVKGGHAGCSLPRRVEGLQGTLEGRMEVGS